MPSIRYSVEYRRLTEAIATIQDDLHSEHPGDFETSRSVLEQVNAAVDKNWDELKWYSASETLRIIASNYAEAIAQSTANLDKESVYQQLMDAAYTTLSGDRLTP